MKHTHSVNGANWGAVMITCSKSEPSLAQLHVSSFCLNACATGDTMLEGGSISCCKRVGEREGEGGEKGRRRGEEGRRSGVRRGEGVRREGEAGWVNH